MDRARDVLLVFLMSGTVVGCQPATDGTERQITGLSVVQPGGKQVIFLGIAGNPKPLLQQLNDSLAGVDTNDAWHRVELPTAMMPVADGVVNYDLATTAGIRIVRRMQYTPADTAYWTTHEFISTSAGVAGPLEISGPAYLAKKAAGLAPDGNIYGTAFRLQYYGYQLINGVSTPLKLDVSIGGLFTKDLP